MNKQTQLSLLLEGGSSFYNLGSGITVFCRALNIFRPLSDLTGHDKETKARYDMQFRWVGSLR